MIPSFLRGTRHPLHRLISTLVFAAVGFGVATASAQAPANVYSYGRASAFTYDETTGLLLTEKIEPDNPNLCVLTTYQYDGYGNKKSATTSNCGGATGNAVFATRSSTSTYAGQNVSVAGANVAIPVGTFPTTVANAINQSETKSFDPRFGAVLSLVGPNSLPTSWEVDDFGRKVKELRADGTSSVSAYCYLLGKVSDTSSNSAMCPSVQPVTNEAPSDAISFVYSESRNTAGGRNGPFARVYMDRAGRKIRSVTEGFDGGTPAVNRLIVQDTDYNEYGVTTVTTQPYFLDSGNSTTGGSGYGMSSSKYDSLGRPVEIYSTDPKGSLGGVSFGNRGTRQATLTTISYTGLVTTTTNDLHQTRKEEKNVDGKVVRVTDSLGAQIAYQHDAFGNLIETKDALQNRVTISYDFRGRKLGMIDPDTGDWRYTYNALGELRWQQSPNQRALVQATTMEYDLLGRLKKRIEPEYISNWSYDTYADGTACNKGIGKLCESSTSNGITRRIVYDNLGRALNTRTTVANGPSFASAISYDSASGRPDTQTYPTGLAVKYTYTDKGFLSKLTLATAATVTPLPATAGGTPGAAKALLAGSVLWQGLSYNAWGQAEQQIYGNNVLSKADFDGITGRVANTKAGIGAATDVMNYHYDWDSLSHLTGRSDANGDGSTGAVTDNFYYDGIGRLSSYTVAAPAISSPSLQRSVSLYYNALGMIIHKSDVGGYQYPAAGSAQPHALQSISVNGAVTNSFHYDANGNLDTASSGAYRKISYTSFNLPDGQNGLEGPSGGPKYTWQYDENHQRIKETRVNSTGTRTTWMLHPDASGGLSFESEQNGATISNRHYLTAGGTAIGVLVSSGALPTLTANQTAPVALATIALVKVEYWHKDHLGSLVSTTDHNGAVTARYSYDPFGKRRTASGNYDANGVLVMDWNNTSSGTDRGYTGHEHLDDVGVIHMNGRIYDPTLGRFMQGDPMVQDPMNLQNYNRYGYCYNNPMTCTDPSGYFSMGDFWDSALKPFKNPFGGGGISDPGGFLAYRIAHNETGYQLGSVVIGGLSLFCNGWAAACNGAGQAAWAGFSGASFEQAVKTGAIAGATSYAFQQIGSAYSVNGQPTYMVDGTITNYGQFAQVVALHGVVGCVSSVAGGGQCGPGALSASFSKAMIPVTGPMANSNPAAGIFISAVVGGTASELGGGKFANGAMTASFGYLFNAVGTALKNSSVQQVWGAFFGEDRQMSPREDSNTYTLGVGQTLIVGVGATVAQGLYFNLGQGESKADFGYFNTTSNKPGLGMDITPLVFQAGYSIGPVSNMLGSSLNVNEGFAVGVGYGTSQTYSNGNFSGGSVSMGVKGIPAYPSSTFSNTPTRTCVLSAFRGADCG